MGEGRVLKLSSFQFRVAEDPEMSINATALPVTSSAMKPLYAAFVEECIQRQKTLDINLETVLVGTATEVINLIVAIREAFVNEYGLYSIPSGSWSQFRLELAMSLMSSSGKTKYIIPVIILDTGSTEMSNLWLDTFVRGDSLLHRWLSSLSSRRGA